MSLNNTVLQPIRKFGGLGQRMIELTRLNGNVLFVNSDLIKFIESSPDTMLTLVNGEKIMVREECGEVVGRVVAYRARLLGESSRLFPGSSECTQRVSSAGAASALRGIAETSMKSIASEDFEIDENASRRRRRPTV